MKNYIIAILLLTGWSSIKTMNKPKAKNIPPRVRYLDADDAMVERALSLIYQKKNQITKETAPIKTTYNLPPIRNSIGIEIGPELSATHYYPAPKGAYIASMIRRVKDSKGNKYTEHYGFLEEDAKILFEAFENPNQFAQTQGETESIYDNP